MRLVLLAAGLALCGCGGGDDNFTRLMRQEGITSAVNEGYAFFGCDKDDTFQTKFSGIKNGQKVSGEVCGGWPKGYTIRYE
jgi:hypothetical protein